MVPPVNSRVPTPPMIVGGSATAARRRSPPGRHPREREILHVRRVDLLQRAVAAAV